MSEPWSPERLARSIGILLLVSVVFGGFGEGYVPGAVNVAGNAGATASNIFHHQTLFRLGLGAYMVEGLCDATLTALLYFLVRPAGRELALVALLMRIVATAAFAASEFFNVAALSVVRADYLNAFPNGQINALAFLLFRLYAACGSIPTLFHGVAWILMGWLLFISGYLPRWLGALLVFAGLSTTTGMLLIIVAPAYSSEIFLLPMIAGMLTLAVWLLAVGIDLPNWQKQSSPTDPQLASM